jgi:hypothetical protein
MATKKTILKENKQLIEDVTKLLRSGTASVVNAEDIIRAARAVRRRHPNLKESRVQRRIKLRLALLGIARRGRDIKPYRGAIGNLVKKVEDAVIAEVESRNEG